jgi:hypothetical protein
MSGATPPLPNTPTWSGAQLKKKHRDNFTFTLLILSTLKFSDITSKFRTVAMFIIVKF